MKPHKQVSSVAVARWIKEILNFSGINTDIFKAHLVLLASKDILRKGNWSGECTWQRFYNKEIRSKDKGSSLVILVHDTMLQQ